MNLINCKLIKKIVWISLCLPFDNVSHAGGKVHNFYINKLLKSGNIDLRLISFYSPEEYEQCTIKDKILCNLFCMPRSGYKRYFRAFVNFKSILNPWDKYGNFSSNYVKNRVSKTLFRYKAESFNPDVIIMEWTQIILISEEIKKIFPKAKLVAIEEDVSFLSLKRVVNLKTNFLTRWLATKRYENEKKAEINALNSCDLVIVNNQKDYNLIASDVNVPIKIWSVYYDIFDVDAYENMYAKDIIFYGAMNRYENYATVKWLLEKVKCLVENYDVRFVIIGGHPPRWLQNMACEKVIVTGFVKNVQPWFRNGLCLAAPLVLGAGIKVKVLESLAAGLPVLTNDIGIEGIPALDGVSYYHCISPDDYATKIVYLLEHYDMRRKLGQKAKQLVLEKFNYEKTAKDFICWIEELCRQKGG